MRYEKPAVMSLNARAVRGEPESCFAGPQAGYNVITCYPGAVPNWGVCDTGGGGYQWLNACDTGHQALFDPGYPAIICQGGAAADACDAGGSVTLGDFNDSCEAGPSNV